tara:strand:+ start:95 stop:949 length:855 start_codon:yes stop_codon:yes gene_type:complete
MVSKTTNINPIRRNIHFKLDKTKIKKWKGNNLPISQFFNTLSLFFPEGERYFIRSVRHFKNQVPEELKPMVKSFIGQEAFHGREHEVLNAFINEANDSQKFDDFINNLIKKVEKIRSPEMNLAVTISLEHLTAILANALLETQEHFEDSDPEYRRMWLWHALEETEHKSVAFDIYKEVMKDEKLKGYFYRSYALALSSGIFFTLVSYHYAQILIKDRKEYTKKDLVEFINYGFLFKPGVVRKALSQWFTWFKPNFHPWDHDNRYHLEKIDSILGEDYEKDKLAA